MERGPWRSRATSERRTPVSRRVRNALLGLFLGWTILGSTQPVFAQETPTFEITVDHQQALFTLSRLLPGPVPPRCLVVELRNGVADAVVLSATVSGSLAPYLSITVDAGEATDPASCGGFSGAVQFAGTLDQFGVRYGQPSSGLAIPLSDRRRTVLRFSLSLADDNGAQGKTAGVTLQFDAQDLSDPPVTTTVPVTTEVPTTLLPTTVPAPTTTLSAPAIPADQSTTTTEAERTPRTTRPAEVIPANSRPPADPSSPDAPDIVVVDAGDARSPSLATRAAEVVRAGVDAAVAAADVTARTTVVPGLFSAVALGFFLIQGRLDRNDPKLADAPIEPEPDLVFEPRPMESLA